MKQTMYQDDIRLSLPDASSHGFVIFLHGSTQGPESLFAQAIVTGLVKEMNVGVFTFPFHFHKNGAQASSNLSDEVEQVMCVMSFIKSLTQQPLALVGKSLGGIIGLHVAAQTAMIPSLISVTILGLPIVLGNPPRLDLLHGKTFLAFDAMQEYRSLLDRISVPVHVVQGDADNLGSISDLRQLLAGRAQMSLDIIPGTDHSFYQQGQPLYEICLHSLVRRLTEDNFCQSYEKHD